MPCACTIFALKALPSLAARAKAAAGAVVCGGFDSCYCAVGLPTGSLKVCFLLTPSRSRRMLQRPDTTQAHFCVCMRCKTGVGGDYWMGRGSFPACIQPRLLYTSPGFFGATGPAKRRGGTGLERMPACAAACLSRSVPARAAGRAGVGTWQCVGLCECGPGATS